MLHDRLKQKHHFSACCKPDPKASISLNHCSQDKRPGCAAFEVLCWSCKGLALLPWSCSRWCRLLDLSVLVSGVTSFPTGGRWPVAGSLELRRDVGCETVVRLACDAATHCHEYIGSCRC